MYVEKLTIQGVRYSITHHDDGTITEDPPLPESVRQRFTQNHKDIVESGEFPGVQTDTAFHANRGSLAKQLGNDEGWAKFIVDRARAKGAVITADHTYISQLADEPGDPAAFVPPGEGRGYIKKVLESKGKGCTGAVEVKQREQAPQKKTRLAEDLVKSQMLRYRKEGRVDKSMPDSVLRKEIIEKHGAKPRGND